MAEGIISRRGGGSKLPDGWDGDLVDGLIIDDVSKGDILQEKEDLSDELIHDYLIDIPLLPDGDLRSVSFSSDGNYLAVVSEFSPRVTIYKINESGGLIKLPNIDSTLGNVISAKFSVDGKYLFVGELSFSPYLLIYKKNGDVFTKMPNIITDMPGAAFTVTVSPNDLYLAVGTNSSPYMVVYSRSGDIFTKIPNKGSLPIGTVRRIAFSKDNTFVLAITDSSPAAYKISGNSYKPIPLRGGISSSVRDASFKRGGDILVLGALREINLVTIAEDILSGIYTLTFSETVIRSSFIRNTGYLLSLLEYSGAYYLKLHYINDIGTIYQKQIIRISDNGSLDLDISNKGMVAVANRYGSGRRLEIYTVNLKKKWNKVPNLQDITSSLQTGIAVKDTPANTIGKIQLLGKLNDLL